MTMAIIFLFVDLFTVGIAYGVYGRKTRYYEGMILGIHMEEQYARGEAVTSFVNDYKKKVKKFYLWNTIAGVLICGLCFWYFSIFMIVWCIWLIEIMGGAVYLIFRNHRRLYDMKVANGWSSEEGGCMTATDTRLLMGVKRAALPVWIHVIPLLALLAPLLSENVRTALRESQGISVIEGTNIAVWATFLFCGWIFHWERTKVYSEDSQVNQKINCMERKYWSWAFFMANICNAIAGLYLLYTSVKTHWISNLDIIIYSGIMVLIVAGMLAGYVALRKAKNRILQEDKRPMYIDDDYYWRNGWYANPDDPRLFVQDRFNGMNYTTNMGKPAGRYLTAGGLVGMVILLIWFCIMMLRMDFIPVHLADAGDYFEITSGYTDTEIKKSELQSVQLLENGLPDEKFNKTNGSADEKQLLGKFEGSETGSCRMYVWLKQSEVIKIQTKKYTIFVNSKDKDQMDDWYEQLKKAEP